MAGGTGTVSDDFNLTHEEVTVCPACGNTIIQYPYKPRPDSLFGNKVRCDKCGHEFICSWGILQKHGDSGGLLLELTKDSMTPRPVQSLLEAFFE